MGGVVTCRRIFGRISFSRSFGDFEFKLPHSSIYPNVTGPLLSIEPEIRETYLNLLDDEFLILACDGLWDVFSSQDAVDFVRSRFLQRQITEQDPLSIARELANEAIYARKSRDNVTVTIVMLTCWVKQVSERRVDNQ